MANIVSKLNLNKTPSLVESNSLIFAKNIRFDVDGSLHKDYGIFPLSFIDKETPIINCLNIFGRINKDIKDTAKDENNENYSNDLIYTNNTKIVGVISDNNSFYLFIVHGTENFESFIYKYDERTDKFSKCHCNWNWSGGKITGNVTRNLRGETILCVCEKAENKDIPFKSINLKYSKDDDKEDIYTQAPNIPITNLNFIENIRHSIPNGTYQFYVRYKIRNNFYTDWFVASKELAVGNTTKLDTSFGTVQYVDTHTDSDRSFKFEVQHLNDNDSYKAFQIGFILSHDDEIVARSWKEFSFDEKQIIFDYNEDGEEIEVIDLLNSTYQLYNIKNITYFKNKQYISNYKETSPNIKDFDKGNASVEIQESNLSLSDTNATYKGNTLLNNTPNDPYSNLGEYDSIKVTSTDETFPFTSQNTTPASPNTIMSKLFYDEEYNLKTVIEDTLLRKDANATVINGNSKTVDLYGITCVIRGDTNITQNDARNYILNIAYPEVTSDNLGNIIIPKTLTDVEGIEIKGYRYVNQNNEYPLISTIFDNTETNSGDEDKEIKIKDLTTLGENYLSYLVDRILLTTAQDEHFSRSIGFCSIPIRMTNVGQLNTKSNVIQAPSEPNIILSLRDVTIDIKYRIWYNLKSSNDPNQLNKITYRQQVHLRFYTDETNIESITRDERNIQSLIPYQKYNFYLHYVKANGEVTNGYLLNDKPLECRYSDKANIIFYPVFKNIPDRSQDGYSAWFASIHQIGAKVGTLFKGLLIENDEYQSIDTNLNLVRDTTEIEIRQGKHPYVDNEGNQIYSKKIGNYYFSSDATVGKYFGSVGIIKFNNNDNAIDNNKLAYSVRDYSISQSKQLELVKCTPFISLKYLSTDINDWPDGADGTDAQIDHDFIKKLHLNYNLLGYICKVYPLNALETFKYFTDGGSAIFMKSLDPYVTDGNSLHLTEVKTGLNIKFSKGFYIYSNYNLNHLILNQDPKAVYKTIDDNNTVMSRLFPSMSMSLIYKFPAMYKEFTRKTYTQYDEDETYINVFDNTIRSSILEGDEASINIVKFNAIDYYNVPTDKGKITNLLGIGDAILVHTEDSVYKFSGSNNLTSTEGEIQTIENEPFDTGIHEVFGSEYGFAGLKNKDHSIVTETGYIFFDSDAKTIYIYGGNNQLSKINDSIEKLFRYKPITNVHFANDYSNNRIFVTIEFNNNVKTTLSYSLINKSFVSLHDFDCSNSFNTKTNCYFISNDKQDVYKINKTYKSIYEGLELDDKLYPKDFVPINIDAKVIGSNNINPITVNKYDSIIDVLVNVNYETIKTLNSVTWYSKLIEEEFKLINENDINTLKLSEDFSKEHACKSLRVYTDTCISPTIDLTTKANDYPISSPDSYKKVRYNQGNWTLNYFRNIQNFNGNIKSYIDDENSLIEGKYFVVRFVFDKDFKLETLSINYSNKI